MRNDSALLAEAFVAAVESVLGKAEQPIALHEPQFQGNEWTYVKECIDSGWVSSVGRWVDELENRLKTFTGSRHVVAVVNGTAALHLGLHVAGVRPGDEVLVPALTFVATANAVSMCGATPHFVDVSARTMGIDPLALEEYLGMVAESTTGGARNRTSGRRIAAIVPMHAFGHPVEIDGVMEIANRFGIPVVEDAAESLGSTYRGRHTGTFGQLGILSFNGNKIVTTGGGGAILTDDEALARKAKHLSTTARLQHRWAYVHDEVAFNYRMPNLNAALGCAQLERLEDFLVAKRRLAEAYAEAFSGIDGLSFVRETENARSNYWLNAVRLDSPDLATRDGILDLAVERGYHCRPVWKLLDTLPMYQHSPRAPLPVAEALEASVINIPSSSCLVERLS